MASLTEHVLINKLTDDLADAITSVGGDISKAVNALQYPNVIREQLKAGSNIRNIELIGDELIFTFDKDIDFGDGEPTNIIKINLSGYRDAYESGEGISIEGKTINVTNPFTQSDKNLLATAIQPQDLTEFVKKEWIEGRLSTVDEVKELWELFLDGLPTPVPSLKVINNSIENVESKLEEIESSYIKSINLISNEEIDSLFPNYSNQTLVEITNNSISLINNVVVENDKLVISDNNIQVLDDKLIF